VQSIVAGAASGLVVPLAQVSGSWRPALGLWGTFVLVALLVWAPRGRSAPSPPVEQAAAPAVSGVRVWRSSLAWQVAGYFGPQSSAFYVLLTWLPTVEQDLGVNDVRAGVHLAVFLLAGIVANLVVPRLLGVGGDQRFATVSAPVCIALAMVGIQLVPVLIPVRVGVAGLGTGASMVLSLSLISLRPAGAGVASRLSSMVQASAYAGVVVALLAAGGIRDLAGPETELVGFVLLIVAGQALMGLRVGRDRRVDT
jgi:CP family cyanate transporter-like MFS transporter